MDLQGKDMQKIETEKKPAVRIRRVGSMTAGVMLVLFGLLFLIHIFVPILNYEMIFHFWPVIFIILGLEILAGNRKDGVQVKYDAGAIFLILIMACFAMVMAGADWLMQYAEKYHYIYF